MILFVQGGGFSIGPNGVCIDCPLSFRDALQLLTVIIVSVALGIGLRRGNKTYVRIMGNCLLIFGALEVFTLNHAGRNWGIIRSVNPLEFYNGDAVSVFSLMLVLVGGSLVVYFRKRPQKRSRETG